MARTILDNPKKLKNNTSVVAAVVDIEGPSESSSLLDGRYGSVRSDSYSSTYEVEINKLSFTKSRVEHDSYYLSPSEYHKRHLGIMSMSMIMISKMFGSGIFATPATVYQNVNGSPVLFFACWILGMVVGFGGMRIYLEFSTAIDKNGGVKTYLQFLYYKPKMLVSCTIGILIVLFGHSVGNALIFAKYSLKLADVEDEQLDHYVALGFIVCGTVLYGFSVKHAFVLQNTIGFMKLVLLAAITLSCVYALLPSALTGFTSNQNLKFDKSFWYVDWENLSLVNFSSAVLKCVFTTGGYQGVVVFTGEAIDPQRTLRVSLPTSLFSVYTCVLIINCAYLAVIPASELMQSDELVGAKLFSKIFGDSYGSKFLTASVAFSCFGNVLISIYQFGRTNQEVFREGFLPYSRLLAANWPAKAPFGGLLASLAVSAFMLLFPFSSNAYDFIINLDSYEVNFYALLLGLGVFRLRWSYSHLRNTIRAPIWTTVVYIGIAVFLMVCPLVGQGGDKLFAYVGVSCLLIGVTYWFVYFQALPRIFRYDIVETEIAMDDGMTVKSWEKLHY